MATLYVDRKGIELRVCEGVIDFYEKGKKGSSVPLNAVDRVVIKGDVKFSSSFLSHLSSRKIGLLILSGRKSEVCSIMYRPHNDARLRLNQFKSSQDKKFSLLIAKDLISRKILGQAKHLEQLIENNKTFKSLSSFVFKIKKAGENILNLNSISSMIGVEGSAANQYFYALSYLVPEELNFKGRNKNPPQDPINAILSLTYTLVEKEILRQSYEAGLDPFVGFIHSPDFGRESLCWDLIEPLRPVIDDFSLKLFEFKKFNFSDFETTDNGCKLNKDGRITYYQEYENQATFFRMLVKEEMKKLIDKILGIAKSHEEQLVCL